MTAVKHFAPKNALQTKQLMFCSDECIKALQIVTMFVTPNNRDSSSSVTDLGWVSYKFKVETESQAKVY